MKDRSDDPLHHEQMLYHGTTTLTQPRVTGFIDTDITINASTNASLNE